MHEVQKSFWDSSSFPEIKMFIWVLYALLHFIKQIQVLRNSNLNQTFTVKLFEYAIPIDKIVLAASVNIFF